MQPRNDGSVRIKVCTLWITRGIVSFIVLRNEPRVDDLIRERNSLICRVLCSLAVQTSPSNLPNANSLLSLFSVLQFTEIERNVCSMLERIVKYLAFSNLFPSELEIHSTTVNRIKLCKVRWRKIKLQLEGSQKDVLVVSNSKYRPHFNNRLHTTKRIGFKYHDVLYTFICYMHFADF